MKVLEKTMPNFSEDMLKYVRRGGNIHEKDSSAFVARRISSIMSGELPVPISYEDSDQTPLFGAEAQFLRNMWNTGLDYIPFKASFFYLSDWLKTIYSGDYEGFLEMIEGKITI